MQPIRRLTAITATATLAAALVLSGCGRDDASGGSQGASSISDGPATGTIEIWAMGTEGERLPEIAKKFEADNPDATVKVTPIPWESAIEKINTAIAAGDVPDVVQVGTTLMSGFVDQNGLAPTPKEFSADDFFPGAWDTTVVGGTSYAVPWYVEPRVLYYRTDLAEAAGVTPPQTWDDPPDFATKIQANGADYGIALQTKGNDTNLMYFPFFWQAGGDIMNADETEFTLGGDAQTSALAYYASFMQKGLAPKVLVEDEKVQNFIDGELGSFVAGPWERANLLTVAGEDFADKFDVTPLPADETSASFIGGSNLAVFKDAKNADGGWKFIRYATQPETQVEWFKISNDLPSVEKSWDDPALADNDAVSMYQGALEDGRSTPAIPTWGEVGHELDLILENVVAGKTTPQDGAAQMQKAAESIGTGTD